MRVLIRPVAAAALGAAALFVVPAANAQNEAPSTAPSASPMPAPSANISDQKLNEAAAAMQNVIGLQHNYQQQIASAPPADKQRIAQEANNAMEKAVTDQGLSVEEYSSILEVAQNDPSVRQKLLQRLHSAGQQ
jgi:hypothetical protein